MAGAPPTPKQCRARRHRPAMPGTCSHALTLPRTHSLFHALAQNLQDSGTDMAQLNLFLSVAANTVSMFTSLRLHHATCERGGGR